MQMPMEAHYVPIVAFSGDAVKSLNLQQQENPYLLPENEENHHDKQESVVQAESDLILYNYNRTKAWKVDGVSFDCSDYTLGVQKKVMKMT
jgi:hypothetical protein